MRHYNRFFIDGSWVQPAGSETITVTNPATEMAIATVPAGIAEDVGRAADAALRAFPAWSMSPLEQRAGILRTLARLIEERASDITQAIVREVGQPIALAARSQTASAIADLKFMAEALGEIAWSEQVGATTVCREAVGVVGAITPWNAPLRIICMKAGAAMAAGCPVVLKGSEVAPSASFLFAELCAEAGVPHGVLNLVSGTGPEVGEAIATHPAIDMVSLTGSVRAGSRVMELAARSIKRVALELGGKSANIVLADADVPHAVAVGIEDAFRNAGQVCGGLSRVLVPRQRLREAQDAAVAKAESYVPGDPFDPATTLGPVISAQQRERVRTFIDAGVREGVTLLTGGAAPPPGLSRGYFVRPTVFSGDNRSRIAREEVFGPVVVIIPFDSEEEAIALANDSTYALAAGVWCADDERARTVAKRIRAGRIRINGSPINQRAPHGGFKMSGIGREGGRYGIEEFLEYKAVG